MAEKKESTRAEPPRVSQKEGGAGGAGESGGGRTQIGKLAAAAASKGRLAGWPASMERSRIAVEVHQRVHRSRVKTIQ